MAENGKCLHPECDNDFDVTMDLRIDTLYQTSTLTVHVCWDHLEGMDWYKACSLIPERYRHH